jgi:hypothetical protein
MQKTPIYQIVREEKRQRAARYREEAERLATIAKSDSNPIDRNELLEMATQYQGLAERLEEDLAAA